MDNKEKDDQQTFYEYLNQQHESYDPSIEQQSFEIHEVYPYEYDYHFSQLHQQNQYPILPQNFPNYGIAYGSIPQSSSGVVDSMHFPNINASHVTSDVPFVINNQNQDQLDVFYVNNSKENQYEDPLTSEMIKKTFVDSSEAPPATNAIFQNESDIQNFLENGHYLLDPHAPVYNEKSISIINNHGSQQLASESDIYTQKKNTRQENDVFNELLSLAASKKQSAQYLADIQQTNYIPSDRTNKTQKKTHEEPGYRNKYKEYSESSSSCVHDQLDLVYNLIMIQQPSRARMCGFGDKDRRPISPPPIAKLIVTSRNGEPISSDTFDISFLVAVCDIWKCDDDDNNIDANIVKHHGSISHVITFSDDNESTTVNMKNLVGSAAVSATKLYDLEGKLGVFFIFHDISLRTEGRFRLRIKLIDIESIHTHTVNTTSISKVLTTVYTDPFVVYTAKKFPGVTDSTPISKCFARQGVKISIRKDPSKNDTKEKELNKNNIE